MQTPIQPERLQKLGGLAALLQAATFIAGFALYFGTLAAADYGNLGEPVRNAGFLRENETLMYAWYFVIYVVFGLALVPLTLALRARLTGSPTLSQLAGVFGFVWAGLVIASGMVANVGGRVVSDLYAQSPETAGAVWLNLQVVIDGLGGGNEIVGGVWLVLVSLAAFAVNRLPKALNLLGLLVGAAGVLTAFPPLSEIGGSVFGLGLIVWFVWVGAVLLRSPASATRLQAERRYA